MLVPFLKSNFKTFAGLGLAFSIFVTSIANAEWAIDLSRRSKEMKEPVEKKGKEPEGFFDFLFTSGQPVQDIVVLNTETGFMPPTLRLREGQAYKIHVVNVNEKEKNVSFVLDSFSEHHATYYGKIKSFTIEPKKEGVYGFSCPETAAQGKVVVMKVTGPQRSTASEP